MRGLDPGPGAPAVSVIVAAYQAAGLLDAALASIAAQSWPAVEVVVVDDGSTDDTTGVARRWSTVLPLTVHRLPDNAGPAAARRRAVELTHGDLLAVLDADDAWLPDHLATLRSLHSGPGTIVSANALLWVPGRGATGTYQSLTPVPPTHAQPTEILRRNFVFCGALFSRTAYDAAGGYRDGFTGAEDWDLWIRMLRRGCRVRPSSAPTSLYRLDPGSLSSSVTAYAANVRVLEAARGGGCSPSERRSVCGSIARAWRYSRRTPRRVPAVAQRDAWRRAERDAWRPEPSPVRGPSPSEPVQWWCRRCA